MALYGPAEKFLLPESSTQSRIKPVLIVLHTNASTQSLESIYRYWLGADTEAHFQEEIGGRLGQYIDTETRADSNSAANSFMRDGQLCGAISIETSDLGNHGDPGYQKTWSDLGERRALEDLLVWLCQTHGIPPVPAYADGRGGWVGIGYHAQVPAWSNAAHICPGPGKIREVPDLIAAVARRVNTPGGLIVTPEDQKYLDAKFYEQLQDRRACWRAPEMGNILRDRANEGAFDAVARSNLAAVVTQGVLAALNQISPALFGDAIAAALEGKEIHADVDVQAIAEAVADEEHRRSES